MFLTIEQYYERAAQEKADNLANWYKERGLSQYQPYPRKVSKPKEQTPYYYGSEKAYENGCRAPYEDPRYCPVCSIQYNRDMCDAGQCDMPCGRC